MSVYLGGPAQNVLVAKWPYEMAAAMMVKTQKKVSTKCPKLSVRNGRVKTNCAAFQWHFQGA